jgi:hypothetical protein
VGREFPVMGKGVYSNMAQKKYKKSPVGGDITDMVPKKSNGAMGFGTWENAMKQAKKKSR